MVYVLILYAIGSSPSCHLMITTIPPHRNSSALPASAPSCRIRPHHPDPSLVSCTNTRVPLNIHCESGLMHRLLCKQESTQWWARGSASGGKRPVLGQGAQG